MILKHNCRFCGKPMDLEVPSDNPNHKMFPVHKSLVAIAKIVSCNRCCAYYVELASVRRKLNQLLPSWIWLCANAGEAKQIATIKLKMSGLCTRWIAAIDKYWSMNYTEAGTAKDLLDEVEGNKTRGLLIFNQLEKSARKIAQQSLPEEK